LCDFGLGRSIDTTAPVGKGQGGTTVSVATRWYRIPEIMLTFKMYTKVGPHSSPLHILFSECRLLRFLPFCISHSSVIHFSLQHIPHSRLRSIMSHHFFSLMVYLIMVNLILFSSGLI
ncbi:hypothetical protein C8R42DRAFT_579921, partial [Lentinula raphanica]